MPLITIRILKDDMNATQKAKAAKEITAILSNIMDKDPERILIHFLELPRENVASAGVLATDWDQPNATSKVTQPKKVSKKVIVK